MSKKLFILILPIFILACSLTPSPTEIQVDSTATSLPTETINPPASGERAIQFSGYEWTVRDSDLSGPGPNKWSGSNVWLDNDGDLHLKITHTNDDWYSAEVTTTQRFGFGKYQFQVIGQIDQLDPNVVLGLFNYPTEDVGPDGTNEIDIEYAHWGNPEWPIGNFTVWPAQTGFDPASQTYPVELNGTYTTQRFTWESQQIFFQSLHGHEDNDENEIANWLFKPDEPLKYIPQQAMPVHINLWLFEGQTPLDGNEVEIIIHSFTFTPLGK
jgi:hypothetical protein